MGSELSGVLKKCLEDPYTYYAYVDSVGWIKFGSAKRVGDERLLLEDPEFVSSSSYPYEVTRSAEQRGIEVWVSDIKLLIDGAS